MIGALWTGISGLASHQTAIDNESHNIANVNTVGYKSSRISFADQIYQNDIGKGSQVVDAQKLFEQGNIKLTGVSYDMALVGDGFYTVADVDNGGGTAETFYTRAGDFRMGEDGNLEDANGNEVQGWVMLPIDSDADVITTNPNITRFTDEYTQLASTAVIRHGDFIETITAKTTDYNETSKTQSLEVFTGSGYKTESGKISDIEVLEVAYAKALEAYQKDPDGISTTSVSQISYIDFQDRTGGIISEEGDIISVYINGKQISQEWEVDYDTTMKKLADQISSIPGLKAYIVEPTVNPLDPTDTIYKESTSSAALEHGIIKIESIIPGQSFEVSGVLSQSGTAEMVGEVLVDEGRAAVAGSGFAAVKVIGDSLAEAVTGKQQNVYTVNDLFYTDADGNIVFDGANPYSFDFRLNIWDNEAKTNVTVPAGAPLDIDVTPPLTPEAAVQAVATAINNNPELQLQVMAKVVNGALVVEPIEGNYDVEFNVAMERTLTPAAPAGVDPLTTSVDKNATHSGREGAGAEYLQMITSIDQNSSLDSIQLNLQTLGISDSEFGEFHVDSTGLISLKQDGVWYAVGQVAIAKFTNNNGLDPVGDNLFAKTSESGNPIYNVNNEKTAEVQGQSLELSEADLSESLVNLMVFQRAYEANAKSITTADQLLTTLINLKQ